MKLTKSLLGWLLRIGVAIAILAYIFTLIPFTDVVDALLSANGFWVAMAFVVLVLERFTAALKVSILTARLRMALSVLKVWEINTVSIFYGTFLPGDLAAGAVRWYRMSKPTGRRAQAFAAIVFERVTDTIALVVFGLLFWFWDRPPYGTTIINVLLIVILGGLVLGLLFSLSPRTSQLLRRIIPWVPGMRLRDLLYEKTEKVLVSVRELRSLSLKGHVSFIALTIIRHLLSILILLCFARALDLDIGFASLGWIRSFMNIITMLPISFSGLGVREGSLVVLLAPYGIPGPQAVALSLFIFIVNLTLGAAGGVLEIKNVLLPARQRRANVSSSASKLEGWTSEPRETS